MASLASDDFIKMSRETGLTPKEQQSLYMLYFAGMYKLAGLSEMVVDPVRAKSIQSRIISSMAQPVRDLKAAGKTLTPTGAWQVSKNMLNAMASGVKGFYNTGIASSKGVGSYIAGGMTEAFEESSETVFDKSFKQAVNSFYLPNTTPPLGDGKRDIRFNVNWENLPTELAAAATLGFGGGVIARGILKHEVMDMNTLLGYGATPDGYAKLDKELDRQYAKGMTGDKLVDVDGNALKPEDSVEKSRGYIAYKAMKNEIEGARKLWQSTGMRRAFETTEQALLFLNDTSMIKQSSIGKDIADKMAEIQKLRSDLVDEKVSLQPEQIDVHNRRIETLTAELEQIKNGQWADRYLHESLYSIYKNRILNQGESALDVIPFDRFRILNDKLRASFDTMQEIKKADELSLEQFVAAKPAISFDKAQKLRAKVAEKHDVTFDDDGTPLIPPDKADAYNAEVAEIDAQIRTTDPVTELFTMANQDGTPGKEFDDILRLEEEKEKAASMTKSAAGSDVQTKAAALLTASEIYDDVDSLEKIREGIMERRAQLAAMSTVNVDYNLLAQRGGFSKAQPLFPPEFNKEADKAFAEFLGRTNTLLTVANENRNSFYNATLKESDRQVLRRAGLMSRVGDVLGRDERYRDLHVAIGPHLIDAMNEGTDAAASAQAVFKAEQLIHDHFKGRSTEFLDGLWQSMGMENGAKRVTQYNLVGTYQYLKSIVTLDPTAFRNTYLTILNSMKDKEGNVTDKRTPLPEQYHNIYLATAALHGGYNPTSKYGSNFEGDVVFTDTFFLNSEQGNGKTFIAAIAARTTIALRGGGRVAVFAGQEELRSKDYKEFLGVGMRSSEGGDLDPSVHGGATAQMVLDYINDESRMKETNVIIVDEATLYKLDDVTAWEEAVKKRWNTGKEETGKVKILLVGDTYQLGAIKANSEVDNIGGKGVLVDRTVPGRFSFRTGNQDILGFVKQLRDVALTNTTPSDAPPTSTFNFDKETHTGVNLVETLDQALSNFLKSAEAGKKSYVVIGSPERLAALQAKHSKQLYDGAVLLPEQVQGRQWDHVFADVPVSHDEIATATGLHNVKKALTVAGRARKSVTMVRYSAYKAITGTGRSEIKDVVFNDEQLQDLRDRQTKAMQDSGATEVAVQKITMNRKPALAVEKVELKRETPELTVDEKQQVQKVLQMVSSKSGQPTLLAHTFYTNLITNDETGEHRVTDSHIEQLWKKQLLHPEQTGEGSFFDPDLTQFEFRLETGGLGTDLLNKPGVTSRTGVPTLNVYAHLYRGDTKTGEMAVASIQQFEGYNAPNARVMLTDEQNNAFMQVLKSQVLEAEKSTVDQFKQEKQARKEGLTPEKKSMIPLAEFEHKNPYYNYSTRIYNRTQGKEVQKAPFKFYSASLTSEQIDEVLTRVQPSETDASERLTGVAQPGPRDISSANFAILAKQYGVFPLALDGGLQVSLDEFLENLAGDKKNVKSSIQPEHKLSQKGVKNIRNWIGTTLALKNDEFDKATKTEVGRKKYTGLNKYVADKVKEFIKPTGDYRKIKRDVSGEDKPGTIKVYKVEADETRVERDTLHLDLHLHPMLLSIYNEAQKGNKQAQQLIDTWKDPKAGIFKYGVFRSHATKADSTGYPGIDFMGAISNEDAEQGEFSVSNLLMPAMPVFKIDQQFVKDVLGNNPMTGYNLQVSVKYEPVSENQTQPDAEALPPPAVVRKQVAVVKDDIAATPNDPTEGAGLVLSSASIEGLQNRWFAGHSASYCLLT